jgi:type II secretory ATPase GspE/PulE/Tfp pilus assembly ATPase PilB-like protein
MILERSDANSIEQEAKKEGMITIKEDGYLKAIEGITTIEEVLRVAQD